MRLNELMLNCLSSVVLVAKGIQRFEDLQSTAVNCWTVLVLNGGERDSVTEQVPGLHTACVTEPTRPRSVDSATNLPPVQTQWRGTRREWQAISESTPAFKWFLIASRSWEATEETSQQAQSHFTFRHNSNPA